MTLDQIKVAIAAAIAFVLAACLAVAFYAHYSMGADEAGLRARAETVADGIVNYERANGRQRTADLLSLQYGWQNEPSIHVWMLDDKGVPLLSGTTSAYPPKVALRAASDRNKSIDVGAAPIPQRLFIAERKLPDGVLFVGATSSLGQVWNLLLYPLAAALMAGALGALLLELIAYRRSNYRINEVNKALTAFANGNMKQRIGFPGPVDSVYELAHEVNSALDRFEILFQNLNSLSADIAHNLKKPMTRLRTRLELASDDTSLEPRFRLQADESVRELDELIRIFEALLNISQLQAGSGRERFKNVDILSLLQHLVVTYRPIIEDSGKKLNAIMPKDEVPPIRGIPELISEMVVNLIENAINHCPAGTTIEVSLNHVDNYVTIAISDDGPGIPASDLEAVFQRFYRLDTSRPGHGIGLPFVLAVANLHGARLELADNNGLTASVRFPIDSKSLSPQLGIHMRSGFKLQTVSTR